MAENGNAGILCDENIRRAFSGAGDFVARQVRCGEHTLFAYSIDGLTSGGDTSDYVIKPISENLRGDTMEQLFANALSGSVYNSVAEPCRDLEEAVQKLVNGFCVVLFPGAGAVAFEVKTGEKRGISAPEVENTVKGPKDAFVETMRSNTSLIRRHLRSPDLRLYETRVGRRTMTNVTVVSLQGITDPELVERMKSRLDSIDIDGLLSPSAVEEYVTGSRRTAFPLLQYTERTDTFCQAILDGRVGLLVDGLPLGYLAPVDIGYLMESPEDRGRDYVSASFIRILRYGALFLSLLFPAIYVSAAVYQPEMIPLPLLRAMVDSKQQVPFSSVTEILALLIAFEILQEAGIHLPQALGQAVSIIGGIVVGTAAVEANLVSTTALITVSIAGVCGFVLPNRDLAGGVRIWRLLLTVFGAIAGLFGMAMGLVLLRAHLGELDSLGVPYLAHFSQGRRMSLLRHRLKKEKTRDPALHPRDRRRQK